MAHHFLDNASWSEIPLCVRYLVVSFGKLRVPMRDGEGARVAEWHWALGLFTDGGFDVLGAWCEEGAGTPSRIASDLHDRGIERMKTVAADGGLIAALVDFHPRVCRTSLTELADSGALGPRMRQAIRWTGGASQTAQKRMAAIVKRQQVPVDPVTAADLVALGLQRVQRDLFHDWWRRPGHAPYGSLAAKALLRAAA